MKWFHLAVLCALWCSVNCFSLDREAFTFTNYDLNLQIDPAQQRLGVRGKITLRNDSQTAQKIAVLQITSSLDWRSITAAGKPLQFVTQPYTSDIDHTGALSEAIVTLPSAIAPKGTIELEVGYEGIIALDTTRLTRIGAPEAEAKSSDWDQISPKFTALRGAGYVAWYPIASDAVDLDDANSLSETLARWKTREAASLMQMQVSLFLGGLDPKEPQIFFGGRWCMLEQMDVLRHGEADYLAQSARLDAPALLIADYQVLERPSIEVHYLTGHDVSATNFADTAEKISPFITEWFGKPRERAKVADLPDKDAASFESGLLFLTPLVSADPKLPGMAAAHQLTHASFLSFRPWIEEGLAHFAQVLYLEQEKGRQAALDYMASHRAALNEAQKASAAPRSDDEVTHSLVNTTNDEIYRSKSMYVWWMLRDMLGDEALKKALAAYKPEADNEPSYMPRLIQAQTQRDMEWFFDDWVYRDHGLPDFKVESAFARKTMNDTYILTITLDNLGSAGAEVPIVVKFAGGQITKRMEVRGKNKSVVRVETSGQPQEILVNDGSVPESEIKNNVFKVEAAANSQTTP